MRKKNEQRNGYLWVEKKRTFFVLLNKNGRSHLKTTTNKKA